MLTLPLPRRLWQLSGSGRLKPLAADLGGSEDTGVAASVSMEGRPMLFWGGPPPSVTLSKDNLGGIGGFWQRVVSVAAASCKKEFISILWGSELSN